jgi:hypothetical protein
LLPIGNASASWEKRLAPTLIKSVLQFFLSAFIRVHPCHPFAGHRRQTDSHALIPAFPRFRLDAGRLATWPAHIKLYRQSAPKAKAKKAGFRSWEKRLAPTLIKSVLQFFLSAFIRVHPCHPFAGHRRQTDSHALIPPNQLK